MSQRIFPMVSVSQFALGTVLMASNACESLSTHLFHENFHSEYTPVRWTSAGTVSWRLELLQNPLTYSTGTTESRANIVSGSQYRRDFSRCSGGVSSGGTQLVV